MGGVPFGQEDECDGDAFRDIMQTHRQGDEETLHTDKKRERERERERKEGRNLEMGEQKAEMVIPNVLSSAQLYCVTHQDVSSTKGKTDCDTLRHGM
jgi:hypothetical protein